MGRGDCLGCDARLPSSSIPQACSSLAASSSQCISGWDRSQGSDKVPMYFAAVLTLCPVLWAPGSCQGGVEKARPDRAGLNGFEGVGS